jgi:hypothetical protein
MPALTERRLILPAQTERAAGSSETAAPALPARGRRELMILVILLACGLFLIPLLIWAVGRGALGPYTDGGPFALLVDFFNGLRSGSLVYWCVALGPYVLVMILRGCWKLLRSSERAAD